MADPGWVYLVHPETGGSGLFPDSPDVLAQYAARGWEPGTEPDDDAPAPAPEPAQPASNPRTAKAEPAANKKE